MKTIYDNVKYKWQHGRIVEWVNGNTPSRWLLGPCPECGTTTSNYGGSFSCHKDYCINSSMSFACGPEPYPDWWNKEINVIPDGNQWCATGPDFINLQESDAGFGDKPRDAVADYYQTIKGQP